MRCKELPASPPSVHVRSTLLLCTSSPAACPAPPFVPYVLLQSCPRPVARKKQV